MLGKDPSNSASYSKETKFGVASLLCRLGFRAHSTSSFASQAVADFMATLLFVDYKHDGVLSSYESEPALAFGATRVWYSRRNALAEYILPQFKKMVVSETLTVNCNGEVIARIVLLLVMDAAVVMESEAQGGAAKLYNTFTFKGQWVGVASFLKLLVGDKPRVMKTKASEAPQQEVQAFAEWQSKWNSWKMGFCQFVQLDEEPTENTLWFLLGHRAAGVLPRNHNGIDPVFSDVKGPKVSMILVQVKNVEGGENCFLQSAGKKMGPTFAFSSGNTLREKSPADMIRVYISLREQVTISSCNRFILSYQDEPVEGTGQEEEQSGDLDQPPNEQTGASVEPRAKKQKSERKSTASKSVQKQKAPAIPNKRKRGGTAEGTVPGGNNSESGDKTLFTYCIRSVKNWEPIAGRSNHMPIYGYLAGRLVDVAKAVWNPEDYVNDDLKAREDDESCPAEVSMVAPKEQILADIRRARIPKPGFRADIKGEELSVSPVGH